MKLKSKTVIPYKGEVIDLNVSNTHTYNVENLAVHNSGGGSLVAYVLYITDLDPIEWDLPFSRFLSIYRCLSPETYVLLEDGKTKQLKNLEVDDLVVTHDGSMKKVVFKTKSKHHKYYKVTVNNSTFVCSAEHEWVVVKDGKQVKKRTYELTTEDLLYTYHSEDR